MERIVLGFDGTPASASALSWVATRASREVATIGVVTVVSRFSSNRHAALDQLSEAEAFLRERVPGVGVELHRLEGGVPESLLEFSETTDLIVMGINPGHPVRATVSGAVPLRTSAQALVPVVMVPAGWVDLGEPVTVGIAADDSSHAALEFAAKEADATAATIRLVHAWSMPAPAFSGSTVLLATTESVLTERRTLLDSAVNWVSERYPTMLLQSELIRDSPSAALLKYSSTSSLLALGTHHRGVVMGSLLGSVGQEVLWHARCPVAVVPHASGDDQHDDAGDS